MGMWRTFKPVTNYDLCNGCGLCKLYCPDSAIDWSEMDIPVINYQGCKGCLICTEMCPKKAIEVVKE